VRAELEKHLGRFGGRDSDRPCGCGETDCPVCRVFGAHMNPRSALGPSRIIVRDGRLRGNWHIENKTENVIDRRTGAAQHPRSNERVIEGTEFNMQIVLQVFDIDESFEYGNAGKQPRTGSDALQAVVSDSLRFVQMTGLGGGTSRGSGAMTFRDCTLDGEPWKHWRA
jgi:CRISPR-associated protein Csm3